MPKGFITLKGRRFRVSDIMRYDDERVVTRDGRIHSVFVFADEIDRLIEEAEDD